MKKITISTDTLKPVLKKLSQAVNSKAVLPVLTNLYCRVRSGEVEFITTDTELTIFHTCACETEGAPFELLLPFDFLQKVVALTGSAPLVIQHPSSRRARIIGVDDVYELNSLDKVADYPKLPEVPRERTLSFDDKFIDCIKKAMATASTDDLRPAMTRICLDINKNAMTIVSTDAHSLYTYKLEIEPREAEQLLISPKVARALEGLDKVELCWQEKFIGFKSDKVLIVATRHEEKYPAYRSVIPNKPANLTIDRNALIGAMDRASLVSTVQSVIQLKKKPEHVCIEAKDIDFERNSEIELPGTYTGDTDAVAVMPKKMTIIMHQVDFEKINLHIHGATKAIVITSEEDKNYLGLIMPLVINS